MANGRLKLRSGFIAELLRDPAAGDKIQARVERIKEPTVQTKRHDSARWRVMVYDWTNRELKHGTVTKTIGRMK